tara:strand:- start:56 stop:1126 length:1071 start_codon:yes stop_codon:yes gene_type:complete
MTIQTNPFITANWRPEHCDPNNWGYKPSTYGVDGVELVGKPHMMLFNDMTGTWTNPARVERITLSKLKDLRDNIHEFGINTKEGRMIYVDADDMSTINGNHRKELRTDRRIDIRGWMVQLVRFKNRQAKRDFANISNIDMSLPHNNPSQKDVEAGVRDALNDFDRRPYKKEIDELIQSYGRHLGGKIRGKILKKIMWELQKQGKVNASERYTTYGKDTVKLYVNDHQDDEWIDEILSNENEISHVMTVYNFKSDLGALLEKNELAVSRKKPLNLLIAVEEPTGDDTLCKKRDRVFDEILEYWEDLLLLSMGMTDKRINRYHFAWNHPDAKHRFLPQDNNDEMKTRELIYVKNRTFN